MSSSNNGFLSRLLTFFLGMIFGMIVLVGGLAGGAYWAYNKVKMSDLEKRFSQDLVGDEFKDDTIKEFFSRLSKLQGGSMTFGELEEMFKIFGDTVEKKYPGGIIDINLSGSAFAQIDLGVLRATPVKDLAAKATDALTVTATLRSLQAIGINIDGMPPIIKGSGDTENPVSVYTLATNESFAVKKAFLSFDKLYIKTEQLEKVSVQDGKISGKYRYYDEYYLSDETVAVDIDENGNVVDNYPDGTEFYIKVSAYTEAAETDKGEKPLYVLTDGLADVPLIEAMDGLSGLFDFESLTLNDMQSKLGITLGSNFMLDKIKDVPINKLSEGVDNEIDNIALVDIMGGDVTDRVLLALMYQNDGTTPVKISGIEARISELTLEDVISIDPNDKLLNSIADAKLNEIPGRINSLKLSDMMDIPSDNNILSAIKNETLTTLPSAVNSLTLQDVVGADIYKDINEYNDKVYTAYGTFEKEKHGFKTLYTKSGATFTKHERSEVFDENGDLRAEFAEQDLYAAKVKDGMWQYLVMDGGEEVGVLVTDLGAHMDTVAANVSSSTLNELSANEIIVFADPADKEVLEKTFPIFVDPGQTKLGEMNMAEILKALSDMIDYVESLPTYP